MQKYKNALKKPLVELIGAVILVAIFVGPFLSFASSRNNIYVDINATGKMDGSASNPYKKISDALAKSNGNSDIHIAKGVYKENIEIPKDVRVFGSDKNDVVITASNDDKAVVTMKNNSRINKVTIRNGENGIKVREDSKVSIIEVIIKDNDKDGIRIESGSTKKDKAVSITESIIRNNGRSGIFSKKHRLVLIDNEISDNDSDGIDIASGSSAWIEDNNIKDNDGSGMKLTLDDSNIWTKSNTYRNNKHNGVEVIALGTAGRIDLNKSKFINNKNFAVARIAQKAAQANIWKGLTSQSNNVFQQSNLGEISIVMRVR